jgi:hypothetical protein
VYVTWRHRYPSFVDKMGATAALIQLSEALNGGVAGASWVADAAVDGLTSAMPRGIAAGSRTRAFPMRG